MLPEMEVEVRSDVLRERKERDMGREYQPDFFSTVVEKTDCSRAATFRPAKRETSAILSYSGRFTAPA